MGLSADSCVGVVWLHLLDADEVKTTSYLQGLIQANCESETIQADAFAKFFLFLALLQLNVFV